MIRFLLIRLLLMVPMLIGITGLTFVVLEVGPVDPVATAIAADEASGGYVAKSAERRQAAVAGMRLRMGLVDADGAPIPIWQRYWRWCTHAVRLDFARAGEDAAMFRQRFGRALVMSTLLGLAGLSVALAGGILVGWWTGFREGLGGGGRGLVGRAISSLGLVGHALPEFVVASGLVLLLGGGGLWAAVLPTTGLRSPESGAWPFGSQLWDLVQHMILPVLAMSIAPFSVVQRHVREHTTRLCRSPSVVAMADLGASGWAIRRAVARQGAAPVAPLLAILVPAMASGSVVVEKVFSLPGLGRLTLDAVLENDVGIVMASTLFVAVVTLAASAMSDVLHRLLDPRVVLR